MNSFFFIVIPYSLLLSFPFFRSFLHFRLRLRNRLSIELNFAREKIFFNSLTKDF